MADDGKISVTLRLLLDNLRADVAKASAIIKAGVTTPTKGTASEADKAGTSLDKVTAKTKRATSSLKEMQAAARAAWEALGKITPNVSMEGESKTAKKNQPLGRTITFRDFITPNHGVPKFSNSNSLNAGLATPPPLPKLPNIANLPQIKAPVAGLGSMIGNMKNLFGNLALPLVGFRVAMGLIKYAVNALLTPFRLLEQAATRVAQIFAQSFLNGRPMAFNAGNKMIGETFGVSEHEAIILSYAMKGLADRFKTSADSMAIVAQSMLRLKVESSSMGESFKALWYRMTEGIRGPMSDMLNALRKMFDVLQNSYTIDTISQILGGLTKAVSMVVVLVTTVISGLQIITNVFADLIAYVLGKLPGFKAQPLISDATKKMIEAFHKIGDLTLNGVAGAKRMTASPWEQMGLVLGNGAALNPIKETARNTRRLVAFFENKSNNIPRNQILYQSSP